MRRGRGRATASMPSMDGNVPAADARAGSRNAARAHSQDAARARSQDAARAGSPDTAGTGSQDAARAESRHAARSGARAAAPAGSSDATRTGDAAPARSPDAARPDSRLTTRSGSSEAARAESRHATPAREAARAGSRGAAHDPSGGAGHGPAAGSDPPPPGRDAPGAHPPDLGAPDLDAVLAAFERYLRLERDLSPHTVRAYLGDVASLFAHLRATGRERIAELDITDLRAWLGEQHRAGLSRTTLARRIACARTFTAFCHRRGWLAHDPGPLLGTTKAERRLPAVLTQEQAQAALSPPV